MALSEAQRFRPVAMAITLAIVLTAAGASAWWYQQAQRSQGEALFRGEQPLPAQLAGQTMPLPAMATRCINCHETRQPAAPTDGASGASGATSARTYASPLSAAWLKEARLRHGGPESAYDAQSLCQVLRNGTDPAKVMVSTVMPRYDATDAQCTALWAYLTSR